MAAAASLGPYAMHVNIPPGANATEYCEAVLEARPPFTPLPGWYTGFVIAVIALYQVYWLVSIIWFYRLRASSQRIKQRNFTLVVLQTCLVPWVLIFGPLRDATGPETWSCDGELWARLMVMPLLVIPFNLRIYNHYALHRYQTLIAKAKLSEFAEPATTADSPTKLPEEDFVDNSSYTSLTGNVTFKMIESQAKRMTIEVYVISSIIAVSPFLLINGILWNVMPQYGHGCYGCNLGLIEYFCNSLGCVIFAPILVQIYKEMKDLPDPLGFWREFHLQITWACAFAIPAFLLLCVDGWAGITVTGKFSWVGFSDGWTIDVRRQEWVDFLGLSFFHFFAVPYQIYMARQVGKQGQMLRENMTLTLSNKNTRKLFERHMISEYAVENIRVWEEISDWKKLYPNMDHKKRVVTARRIYNGFIPNNAFMCVNISATSRQRLIDLFSLSNEQVGEKLTINLFDDVLNNVEGMMMGAFARFEQAKHREMIRQSIKLQKRGGGMSMQRVAVAAADDDEEEDTHENINGIANGNGKQ